MLNHRKRVQNEYNLQTSSQTPIYIVMKKLESCITMEKKKSIDGQQNCQNAVLTLFRVNLNQK